MELAGMSLAMGERAGASYNVACMLLCAVGIGGVVGREPPVIGDATQQLESAEFGSEDEHYHPRVELTELQRRAQLQRTPSNQIFRGRALVDAAEDDDARCLDGTPAYYWTLPGWGAGTRKWIILQKGGLVCNTLDQCRRASTRQWGSSRTWLIYDSHSTLIKRAVFLSWDCRLNPYFCNWNKAVIGYCDGGAFTGSNSTTTFHKGTRLYFRGRHILKAVQADLLKRSTFANATDIILAGYSFGGLSIFYSCDEWAAGMSRLNSFVRVACATDASFFTGITGTMNFRKALLQTYQLHNSSGAVHPACMRAAKSIDRCYFAESAIKYVSTPLFVSASPYDQLGYSRRLGSLDPTQVHEWAHRLVALINRTVLHLAPHQWQNALFLHSCYRHRPSQLMRADGVAMNEALWTWFRWGPTCRRAWIDDMHCPRSTGMELWTKKCCWQEPPSLVPHIECSQNLSNQWKCHARARDRFAQAANTRRNQEQAMAANGCSRMAVPDETEELAEWDEPPWQRRRLRRHEQSEATQAVADTLARIVDAMLAIRPTRMLAAAVPTVGAGVLLALWFYWLVFSLQPGKARRND